MKKTAKFLLPLMLGMLIIASIVWYLFIYDRGFTRDTLLNQARYQDMHGNSRLSSVFYNAAYKFSGHDENVAIELANQYKQDGNYTKVEFTLTEAIHSAPTVELYTALSRAYVEQDKLLDAVNLLNNVSNPEIKAQLDLNRPIAPVPDSPAGFYSEYIHVKLDSKAKYIFYTTDGTYPTIEGNVYQEPVTLPSGETTLTAIAVNEDGLVSTVATLDYTITGVIEEVVFEDAAIKASVQKLIGVPENELILSSQLWGITEFAVPENTENYSDLAHLPHLTHLSIKKQKLTDLEFLSALTKLQHLNLSECSLDPQTMSVIATLPALEELILSNCSLSTIDFLENAPKLQSLDLSSNNIRNLDALTTIPSLKALNLQHNAVTALDSIAVLTGLEELNVNYNSISTLSPLASCTMLTKLEADHNALTGLDGLKNMTGLKHLSVDYNEISNVSALATNTELVNLSFASNSITDIAALAALNNLEILDFSSNQIGTLPQWNSSCPMQTIDGSYNALTSIDSLSNLQSLTHVYMDYNLITNVDSLENCFCLVQLNVFGNVIADVSGLRDRDIIVNYDPTLAAAAAAAETTEATEAK